MMLPVIIPSYHRPDRCAATVLQLVRHCVPEESITVFVVGEDLQAYNEKLLEGVNIELTDAGLDNAYNTILRSLDGQRFVKVDDDVEAWRWDGELVDDVLDLFEKANDEAGDAALWARPMGHSNPHLAAAAVMGFAPYHGLKVTVPTLVGVELSCQAKEGGGLALIERIQYHAEMRTDGGLGNGPERKVMERSAYRKLTSRYPQYFERA